MKWNVTHINTGEILASCHYLKIKCILMLPRRAAPVITTYHSISIVVWNSTLSNLDLLFPLLVEETEIMWRFDHVSNVMQHIDVMFLGMVMWIAYERCTLPLCIALYCLCIEAVAYFCYSCGYLHCMKPYCREFRDVKRRWSIAHRRISSEAAVNHHTTV